MSISMDRSAGLAAFNGVPSLLNNSAPGSARKPPEGKTSPDAAAWAMFAEHGARQDVAPHATCHITPHGRHDAGPDAVAERRPAPASPARLRRAAVGPAPDTAPNTAADIPADPHTFGERALEATMDAWKRAGKHQDLVAGFRDAVKAGHGLDSAQATSSRVAFYDAVIKAWREDGTFDKVVRASVEVLKQGGAYEGVIQQFRGDFYPELDLAQAEKKFLADLADWDHMSPMDKRISFAWYIEPRRMLGDEPADDDAHD